jgi:hypothetical protein
VRGQKEERGGGGDACTSPYVEGYRGQVGEGSKSEKHPHLAPKILPKLERGEVGGNMGSVRVSLCDVIPRHPPKIVPKKLI